MDKEQTVRLIKGRIMDEYHKHPNLGGAQRIVQFATSKGMKPFISKDLMARIENPIKFNIGTNIANGYEATI